jgi:aspartyl aminopeptidase
LIYRSIYPSWPHSSKGLFESSLLGPSDRLLGADLFLVPAELPSRIGPNQEMVASYRLDNLASAYPVLQALCEAKPQRDRILMGLLWDHEEIGSHTAQGAASPFAQQLLTRCVMPWGLSAEQQICLGLRSLCLSVDVAHGYHPAHAKKFDPRHRPLLGAGIVFKTQAGQRYLSDATTQAALVQLAHHHQIPIQWYAPSNTVGAGSTIGPIHGTATGMPTVDIGPAILSMHSIREVAALKDLEYLSTLLISFFS